MTQSELGKLLGIGPSAVSMIFSGSRPITADHARRLGKRFCVDPGLFL
jgi:plasmid maintenance system antidote protein VapI